MMFTFRFLAHVGVAVLGGAALASALAQTPVAFEASKSQAIKRIDVLDVSEPTDLLVYSRPASRAARRSGQDSAAPSPKVTGAQEDIAATADASLKLKAGIARRNMTLSSELARQVVAALKSKGYDARLLAGHQLRMKVAGGFDGSGVKSGADAVLNIRIRAAGFLPHQGGPDVLPTVSVDAMLVSAHDQAVLYRQLLSAGASLGPTGAADYVPLPQQRKYDSRAAVVADVDNAVDGLRDASAAVAARIAEQLAK